MIAEMRWVFLLGLSGCSSILGIEDFRVGDAGSIGDDAATVDAASGCLGPDGFFVCDVTASGPLSLETATFNTDTDPMCAMQQPASWIAADQPPACFLVGTTIRVPAKVMFTGTRPPVLVATDSITITSTGALDVAGHRVGSATVPRGTKTTCTAPTPAGDENGNAPGAGGAGGSFGSRGGNGAAIGAAVQPGIAAAPTAQPIAVLRGGCPGGDAGRGGAGQTRPPAGVGGGAVYLVAANAITIDGFINASGSGSLATTQSRAGGGGAGSGGMILLHATTIGGAGSVVANGGGASSGSDSTGGASGFDPDPTNPFVSATGGETSTTKGGDGFAGSSAAKNGTGSGGFQAGGAGGGGGAGYIRANASLSGLRVSPSVP